MSIMKNAAILSVSLVALSGTAGLGLSALNEFNVNVQTSALSTPDSLSAESGFVIPDYVPDVAQFAAFAPTVATPELFEAPVVAPVETAALGDLEIAPDASEAAPFAPAVRKALAKSVGASKPTSAPIFVAQTAALIHTPDAATRIDYMIGVYR